LEYITFPLREGGKECARVRGKEIERSSITTYFIKAALAGP